MDGGSTGGHAWSCWTDPLGTCQDLAITWVGEEVATWAVEGVDVEEVAMVGVEVVTTMEVEVEAMEVSTIASLHCLAKVDTV